MPRPIALCIGGFDPSGNAGLLIDTQAVRAVGVHCISIIAVDTLQTTTRFINSSTRPPQDVIEAIRTMQNAYTIGAIKLGALGSEAMTRSVASHLKQSFDGPIIVDPVIRASSGGALNNAASDALMTQLLPAATLITPNVPEATAMTGIEITGIESMKRAAFALQHTGCPWVLIKGGHLPEQDAAHADITDLLLTSQGNAVPLRQSRDTQGEIRGTGCALASLVSAYIAVGNDMKAAVVNGIKRLRIARSQAYDTMTDAPRTLRF